MSRVGGHIQGTKCPRKLYGTAKIERVAFHAVHRYTGIYRETFFFSNHRLKNSPATTDNFGVNVIPHKRNRFYVIQMETLEREGEHKRFSDT